MIRPYTSEDRKNVLHLLKLNTPRYFDVSEEQDFIAFLEKHLQEYFVVEENGRIIGSGGINYLEQNTEARLSWDMVHPNFQGKGAGEKLTHYRLGIIQNKPSVEIIKVRTTQLVYKFYEKMGFKLQKTEKDFWAKGFDLYQMVIYLKNKATATNY